MLASGPLPEIAPGVRREKNGPGVGEGNEERHVARRMAWRLQQPDRSVAEQIQLAFDASPVDSGSLEVLADVSVNVGRFCVARRLELLGVDGDGRVGKVPERAGVVDVQVRLQDMSHRLRRDFQPAQLGDTVLLLGHVDAEWARERAPVRASIWGDGEWVAAVDDHIAVRVADQKERHRHLDRADLERAAAEQVEHDAGGHVHIVWVAGGDRWGRGGRTLTPRWLTSSTKSTTVSAPSCSTGRTARTRSRLRCSTTG